MRQPERVVRLQRGQEARDDDLDGALRDLARRGLVDGLTQRTTARGHELDGVMGTLAEIGSRWEAEDAAQRGGRAAELKADELKAAE